jgi:excisionase family DNA binding protein
MTQDTPLWLPPALHGRLALRPQEAADALGISRTTIDQEIADGRLRSKKLGHARLIPIEFLIDWLRDHRVH